MNLLFGNPFLTAAFYLLGYASTGAAYTASMYFGFWAIADGDESETKCQSNSRQITVKIIDGVETL